MNIVEIRVSLKGLYLEAIIGGVIIGIAVSVMLLFNGRVTGISGIVGEVLKPASLDKNWRILFLLGLILGGFTLKIFHPSSFQLISQANTADYIIAGLFVGFGTLMSGGCTSGHGVCGLSRFSLRSLVATITFMISGMMGVILFKILKGEL